MVPPGHESVVARFLGADCSQTSSAAHEVPERLALAGNRKLVIQEEKNLAVALVGLQALWSLRLRKCRPDFNERSAIELASLDQREILRVATHVLRR